MRVSRISIRNVLGFEELEFEPGEHITVVSGKNGQGKSSVIDAIRSVIDGGHDATLLRNGAEAGEVVLLLDDGVEVRKRITEKGSTVTVKHPEFGALKSPQTYLGRLTDALSVNPVTFLTARPKDRTDYLLEAVPMELDMDELATAIRPASLTLTEESVKGHALDVIARVRARLYDSRTAENRTAKDKRAAATQLAAGLPPENEEAPVAGTLREQKEAIRTALAARLIAIERARDAEIDALREDTQRKIDQLRADATARAEEIKAEAAEKVWAEEEGVAGDLERLTGEIATAEERERQAERDAANRELMRKMSAEADAAEAESAALTAAIEGVDKLKAKLLGRLPFKGLEIRDGDIYHEGVIFDRLNTAVKVQVAMNVARLRAGKLGLVCVDGLECLDRETFAAFRAQAASSNVQMIVTRVNEDDLKVEAA